MNALTLTSRIARNDDVAYTYMDDDMVLMGPEDQLFYGVNPVGGVIWAFLEGGHQPMQAICDHLQTIYEVNAEQCIEDALQFVHQMQTQGMLIVSE